KIVFVPCFVLFSFRSKPQWTLLHRSSIPNLLRETVGVTILSRISVRSLPLFRITSNCLILTAFVGTSLAFACFSAAALVARRREYLYIGGLLSSGLSILMWLHFASSVFGGSTALFKFELYFGLLVFVGYVVVDTQEIIERAHFGDLDYVKHALTLFTDLAAIFVRILVIMLKNTSEKNERKKKRRD
ncbi:bax inhibitor 1-like, partial [Cicer arietinum]